MSTADNSRTFERLLRPHFDRLYRLAWRLAGNKADAEDLFQDLLVKAWGKLDDLVHIDEPGPWLGRVMYNLFVDERRRYRRWRLVVVGEGELAGEGIAALAGEGGPGPDNERLQRLQSLEKALAQLSEEHRIVVLLHDTEGYKINEIEVLTGIPEGTVKSRLHRARARLREILAADGTIS
jgi:RNA polymerase sigma-70 factor (ECF subfamily)